MGVPSKQVLCYGEPMQARSWAGLCASTDTHRAAWTCPCSLLTRFDWKQKDRLYHPHTAHMHSWVAEYSVLRTCSQCAVTKAVCRNASDPYTLYICNIKYLIFTWIGSCQLSYWNFLSTCCLEDTLARAPCCGLYPKLQEVPLSGALHLCSFVVLTACFQ